MREANYQYLFGKITSKLDVTMTTLTQSYSTLCTTAIIPSFMVYDHNSRGQLFCNLPAKINDWSDEICRPATEFLNFSYHFLDIIRRSNTFKNLKSINEGLYETSVSGGNFDGITIKLGIISICPVALSCYSSPTSSLVPREDDGKHLTSCVGQMPNNLPSGQIISNI